jgi:hypothetical protein
VGTVVAPAEGRRKSPSCVKRRGATGSVEKPTSEFDDCVGARTEARKCIDYDRVSRLNLFQPFLDCSQLLVRSVVHQPTGTVE